MNQPSSPLPEIPPVGFLSDVSAEDRAFLTGFGCFLRPHASETFIAGGSAQESLSLVLAGTLHVVSDAGGRSVLLAVLGEGDSLGEINLFDPAVASASVIARSDCLIWSITRDELDVLTQSAPEAGMALMRGLLRQLSHRIREMNRKLADSEMKATFHEYWNHPQP